MAIGAKVASHLDDRAGAPLAAPPSMSMARGAAPPLSADYVLVAVTRSSAVQVSGVSSIEGMPAYLTPPPFASLPQAILAAHQWADEHGVGLVLLRDRTAS